MPKTVKGTSNKARTKDKARPTSKADRETEALIEREKVTPGVDLVHPTDTAEEAARKLAEAGNGARGVTDNQSAAADTVKHEVAARQAADRKELLDGADTAAKNAAEAEKDVAERNLEAERARVRKLGVDDVPVYKTKDSCQTCADFESGYRNDRPCGHTGNAPAKSKDIR